MVEIDLFLPESNVGVLMRLQTSNHLEIKSSLGLGAKKLKQVRSGKNQSDQMSAAREERIMATIASKQQS